MIKKSNRIRISAILVCSLFIISAFAIANSKDQTTTQDIQSTNVNNQLSPIPGPLTNSEIQSMFPNLPTATQLWNGNGVGCGFVDTSTDFSNSSGIISNDTDYSMNYLTGELTQNINIWLQYNSTVWINVPQTMLQSAQGIASP